MQYRHITQGLTSDAAPRTTSAAIAISGIAIFLLYSTLVLFTLAFIHFYAVDVPQKDDWSFIFALTTPNGPSVHWLWTHEADHRMPLLKTFLWLCWRISPGSLRLPLFVAYAIQAITIGILLTTLSRRTHAFLPVAAASIPLLLLHPMYEEIFTWYTTTSAMLFVSGWGFLLTAAFIPDSNPVKRLIAMVTGIVLLIGGSGTSGVVVIVPVLISLIIYALHAFYRTTNGNYRVCAFLGALGLLYVIIYFISLPWSAPQGMAQEASWWRRIEVAGQFLTAPLGLVGRRVWPLSVLVPLGIYLAGFFYLWKVFRNRRRLEHSEVLLLGLVIGNLLLAMTVGIGRERQGALLNRYGFYSAPGLLAAILLLEMHARRSFVRCMASIPEAVMLCLLGLSISDALAHGKDRLARAQALYSDILSGTRNEAIVAKHAAWGVNESSLEVGLRFLKAAGIYPYDLIREMLLHSARRC